MSEEATLKPALWKIPFCVQHFQCHFNWYFSFDAVLKGVSHRGRPLARDLHYRLLQCGRITSLKKEDAYRPREPRRSRLRSQPACHKGVHVRTCDVMMLLILPRCITSWRGRVKRPSSGIKDADCAALLSAPTAYYRKPKIMWTTNAFLLSLSWTLLSTRDVLSNVHFVCDNVQGTIIERHIVWRLKFV
jgi:hypothetical protein